MKEIATHKYHTKRVESSYDAIMKQIDLEERVGRLRGDSLSALNIFQNMLELAGREKIDKWVEGYSEDNREFDGLWVALQKSLRQVDFFELGVNIRVPKDCDYKNNWKELDTERLGTYKTNGDLSIELYANGIFDSILRSSMQCTDGPYKICKDALAEKVKNVVNGPGDDRTIKDFALKAFHDGSDKYGETPTGKYGEMYFNEMTNGWHISVLLTQDDGHPCTSGIGFYEIEGADMLKVCSGHILPWMVDMTPEIKKELDAAPVVKNIFAKG